MAGRQAAKSSARRSRKSAKTQATERATQTWRQPPATPRAKMVRKETRTARVARPGASPLRIWLRRINWVQVGIFAILIAAASGAAYGITLEPFQVSRDSVEVTGNRRLATWEVVDAAQVAGQNVFVVRADTVADRLLALPGVKSVGVRVHLPNQVIIDVAEYLPLVEWQRPDGRRWLAEDGSLVPIAGNPPSMILVDPRGEAADADGKLRKSIREDLTIIQQVLPEQHEIYYGASEGLYFRAPEGWNVYLGEEGDVKRKLEILAGLQNDLITREPKPKKVDLRFPEFPTLE
jgi:cell division septal protein FtsQ